MAPAGERRPVWAAFGSAVIGALYGLILFRVLLAFVQYLEIAVLVSASAVALSVALLSRYQRSLIGTRKSRVWLPTWAGTLAGSVAGVAALWVRPALPWLLTFLPVGAFAGGLTSYVAEVLAVGLPTDEKRPANGPIELAWTGLCLPITAWLSQAFVALYLRGAPAEVYVLVAGLQACLLFVGVVLTIWALARPGGGGLGTILPAGIGLVISGGTLLLVGVLIVISVLH